MTVARNVLGGALETCGESPVTGFFRDGECHTCAEDTGIRTVCAEITDELPAFSRARGNGLTRAAPEAGFPGLQDGDTWCLCAGRWIEALKAGVPPRVLLQASHEEPLARVQQALKAQIETGPRPSPPPRRRRRTRIGQPVVASSV